MLCRGHYCLSWGLKSLGGIVVPRWCLNFNGYRALSLPQVMSRGSQYPKLCRIHHTGLRDEYTITHIRPASETQVALLRIGCCMLCRWKDGVLICTKAQSSWRSMPFLVLLLPLFCGSSPIGAIALSQILRQKWINHLRQD